MKLDSEKVLITGADGFIGSHLVEACVHHGADVRGFVYYNSFNSWGWLDTIDDSIKNSIQVIPGDVRDSDCVRNAMHGCRYVFHLAALIGIPYSYKAPQSYVETNISGTLNVLQAAQQMGDIKVIHTSTSEVYGTAQFVPITENHPLHPQSPYAATKVAADQLALSYHRSFGLPVSIVRPFNTYGPRQSTRAVIPTIITQCALGTNPLQLGAVEPTRDFCFVEDTAQGFIAVAEHDTTIGAVLNLGAGFEISIGETATLIADLMNTRVDIATDTARVRPSQSEVTRLWADTRSCREKTGWTPHYSGKEGFRKGLQKTIHWYSTESNRAFFTKNSYTV